MFYLKEFFKSIGESPLRGTSFLFFSCLLAMALTHRPWVAKTIVQVTPEKMVNPYFVAVIDGSVDAGKMKNILARLPGVVAIDDKESERSRSKLNTLVGQLGADYSLDANLMNFKSLRVVMNPSLSTESLNFVRNQAVAMGGKDRVSATEIKFPEVTAVMKAHPFYSFITKAGDWGVIAILGLFWIISYWLCYDVFRSRSYIIEKFQRKKLVAAKSIATGLGLVFVTFTVFGIWNGTLKVMDSVILLMIFSVFWTFSMQEWRWKPTL
jgi:hypothetical protein